MTNSNDTLKIDTPENVTFDYATAGIGSRFLAALVDSFIIIILQVVVFGTIILLFNLFSESFSSEDSLPWILAILGLISFGLLWGYYILFEIWWNGQTPGKRLVGLRVIRADGTPISVSESVIRNLVRLIDFLPLSYGVGVVTMFIDTNSRRVGDLAAGTVVVHDRQIRALNDFSTAALSSSLLSSGASSPGSGQDALPGVFPIERLTQQDQQVIEEFLLRRNELSNRSVLARHILKSLVTRLDLADNSLPLDRADEILAGIYSTIHSVASEE